jgi:ketosteroid isomerase-like protein
VFAFGAVTAAVVRAFGPQVRHAARWGPGDSSRPRFASGTRGFQPRSASGRQRFQCGGTILLAERGPLRCRFTRMARCEAAGGGREKQEQPGERERQAHAPAARVASYGRLLATRGLTACCGAPVRHPRPVSLLVDPSRQCVTPDLGAFPPCQSSLGANDTGHLRTMSTHSASIVTIVHDGTQILREGFEAFSSGDIERIVAITHPEFEGVVPPELSTEPDTYRGHAGIRRYFASFTEAFDEIRFEPEGFWEAEGGLIVVSTRMTAKGKTTAIPVEQRNALVCGVRDGKLRSIVTYPSLAEALQAAGLSAAAPASAE